jgi:hypothetical protein
MTLRERFKNIELDEPYIFISEPDATECEKITDDFAIGFAEWLYKWDNTRLPNGNWIIKLGLKPYTSEEILEIYKKEKGL